MIDETNGTTKVKRELASAWIYATIAVIVSLGILGAVAIEQHLKQNSSTSYLTDTQVQTLIYIPERSCDPDSGKNFPSMIRIAIGVNNTVVWKNLDKCPIAIVDDEETFRSQLLSQNQSWQYTFNKIGAYHYHGEPAPWLRGSILVVG